MAIEYSFNQCAWINQHIASLEDLNQDLAKVEALANVAITTEFFELPRATAYHYLWVLSDMISQAKTLNEQTLNALLQARRDS